MAKAQHNKQALEVLKTWPTDGEISTLSGQAGFLAASGNINKAREAYGQAIKKDPNNHSLFFNRGQLHAQQNNFFAAAKDFKTVSELGGADPDFLMHYGNVLVQPDIDDKQKALELYRRSFNSGYRHPVLLNNYASLLAQLGQNTEREKVLGVINEINSR